MVREARVEHVFRYAHVFPRCIAMLSSGAIDVKPLITRTFGFDDSVEAFELAASAPAGEVKMQIETAAVRRRSWPRSPSGTSSSATAPCR